MTFRSLIAAAGVLFSRVIVFVHDILTLPIYFLIDKPWRHWRLKNRIWAEVEVKDDPYSSYIRKFNRPDNHLEGVYTMCDLLKTAVASHGNSRCFGTREVFGEEEYTTKSGKVLKKLSLGDYQWMTYNEVDAKVETVSKGLLSIGITSKKPVVLLAETRVEWIISAHACFRVNVPVVTLYANLGDEGLAHGINETEVTHIITSVDLLGKLINVFHLIPAVTHVIYMEGMTPPDLDGIPSHVKVTSFSELIEIGKGVTEFSFIPPTPEDLGILMYTSGSTGIPKGVMLTNKNVITTIKGFSSVLGTATLGEGDVYIAYLPLAHVLELSAECYILSLGIPVGFSTPQTLTDFSTAVKKGCRGDFKVLQPTLMASVPLMLDRIRKSILTLAGAEGTFSRSMFDFAISYKHLWSQLGFQTPRLNKNLLETYQTFLGGRLRYVMSGGAPISKDTQNFIRSCLNVRMFQGYGMTETAACATIMDVDDFSSGRVGAPLCVCKVRLVDWADGGYYATDHPRPRGEIVVGGDCVSEGYFKMKEETKQCFRNEDGMRWFYSGDIGEVYPDGTFKIIDRKKDLVKLQFGEFVALGKVEAELKTCPLVENVCVFGNGYHSFLVALVVPNQVQLSSLAKTLGKGGLSFAEMCLDEKIVSQAVAKIRDHGTKCRLFGSELPAKVKLCSDEWHPDSGLVTAAFKLRRKAIQEHYADAIDEMYSMHVPNGTAKSA